MIHETGTSDFWSGIEAMALGEVLLGWKWDCDDGGRRWMLLGCLSKVLENMATMGLLVMGIVLDQLRFG